ncbi:MAG: hypothetical protein H0T84_00060 [Tatlockia sp.]|nr:hypothetical protein [Tatlockia sp.]
MDNLFFRLEQVYRDGFRQSSNTTCGPASVILATRGLGFKSEKESRWSEEGLRRWLPITDFLMRGMALHELQFVSELIYEQKIDIQLRRAYPENFHLFLNDIEEFFLLKNTVIIVNYLQDDFVFTNLCEHGNPHYSPLISWNSIKNEILIADVDPDINEAYWVSVESMFRSMEQCTTLKIPRGWLKLRKR